MRSVYAGGEIDRLLSAIDVAGAELGSPVAVRLADELVAGQYRAPRSAISSLRREGNAAIAAVPAIGAWIRTMWGNVPDNEAGYAVREALLALGDLRRLVSEQRAGAADGLRDALDTLGGFLAGEVEALARALLTSPAGRAQRGAISFLRGAAGDLEGAVGALGAFLDAHPGETGDGDFDYARADAMTAMQEISARMPRAPRPAPDAAASDGDARATVAPDIAATPAPAEPAARRPGSAALIAAWEEAQEFRGPGPDAVRIAPAVAAMLVARALHDEAPSVRVAALGALSPRLVSVDELVEIAEQCLTAAEHEVRAAAVHMLARAVHPQGW